MSAVLEAEPFLRMERRNSGLPFFVLLRSFGGIGPASSPDCLPATVENMPNKTAIQKAVQSISRELQKASDPAKKIWWERYLKHEISFYGTPMASIRKVVKNHVKGMDPFDPQRLRQTTWDLMRQPIAEQKLAGILILQEHLLDELDVENDLHILGKLLEDGYIADWNTTDWLCVRVLGPMAFRLKQEAIAVLTSWSDSSVLWRKRASLVAFVNAKGQHSDAILAIADKLVHDERRFCQTAVGWSLRNLSEFEPRSVVDFCRRHKSTLSSEAFNMTTAKLSSSDRKKLGIASGGKRKRR